MAGTVPAARDSSYDRSVRSLRTTVPNALATVLYVAVMAAAVLAAVFVIAFSVFVVARHVWRSQPPPRGAMVGMRCHWNGPWLIARGTVVNLGDRDATFAVRPDVTVAGGRSVAANESEYIPVRGGSGHAWRWTNDHAPVPAGTSVTRCSATVSASSGGEGDD